MPQITTASLTRRFGAWLIAVSWLAASLSPAWAEKTVRIFNGKDLTGWEGNRTYWSVQEGTIIGKLDSAKWSTYLVTKSRYRNFRLIVTVKQVVKNAHSGIAYCAKDTKSIGEIIRGLVLIWEVLEPEEMANRVEFL